jgi:hypothetical protein
MKLSPLRIFLSSTTRDLADYRNAVERAIKRTEGDYVCIRSEDWGARPDTPASFVPEKVRDCDLMILLIGQMYGSSPPGSETSFTELEYETALEDDIPVLPFLIHPKVYPSGFEPEPEAKQRRLEAFRRRVEQAHGRAIFREPDGLEVAVLQALRSWERDRTGTRPVLLLADYRAHLRRLYADLPLSGIPIPLEVTLPLDRVYIKLRALPEREETARREATLPPDHGEELPRRLAERLWQQREREELEEAARRLEEAQPIPPEEAVTQHDRLAILGEAGAGKSTLLRHLAWERAGDPEAPLPLLVPLGRTDTLISQTGCSFLGATLDLLTEHKAGEEREALKQALEDVIRGKKVMFLCDGLDEAHLARRSVVAGLEKLAADGHRLVVTSRPLGYERLAARDMEHFQVLPLLPEDAQAFSDRWFRALAQARGVPEAEREGWARERADWLQRQLDERPGLREVARNPLLLTFLAVLAGDEPQRDLPHRRKELYREYVERLFTVWEARRQREGELSLGRLRGEEARRVVLWGLYRTAWHLHRAYYGEEGRRAVRGEIEPLLARDLGKRWEIGTLEAEALAAEVLRFWEGAGLLDVYRLAGQEWLAFRHLTFQEYGAARALAEAYRDDADGLWQCVSPYLLRPQWAGTISLTVAHLNRAQATTLVERLLKANIRDEDWQRPLFLVAAALAEGAEVADAPQRRVVDTLLNLARTREWRAWQRLSVENAISALGRLVGDGYAALGLLGLARDPAVDDLVRVEAAEALGELGQAEEAAGLLSALARDRTVDGWVRAEAAEALGGLGQTDEAVELLLALFGDAVVEAKGYQWAAAALRRLRRAGEARECLLAVARDETVDDGVRVKAMEALGRLGQTDEAAELLLALAQDQALEAKARERAVEVLGRLRRADDLLSLARDTTVNARVRGRAVVTLLIDLERADDLLSPAWDTVGDDLVWEWVAQILSKPERAAPKELAWWLQELAKGPGTPERIRRAARRALGRLEG